MYPYSWFVTNLPRYTLPLPSADSKLSVLREQIAEVTRLPIDGFKMVHSGAVMKDNNALCQSNYLLI